MGTLNGLPFETVPLPLFKIKVLHTQICPDGTYPNQKPASISRFFWARSCVFSERHSNLAALAPDGNYGRSCKI